MRPTLRLLVCAGRRSPDFIALGDGLPTSPPVRIASEVFPHASHRWVRIADTFLNIQHAPCGCDPAYDYAFLVVPLDLTLADGFGYKPPRCKPTQTQSERP